MTGSSALGAFGQAIGTVGDNIANVSTVGFKSSRAGFSDILGGMGPNGQRAGGGVSMAGAQTMLGQGSLQGTGRSLDLAVRGRGFFAVKGNHDGAEGTYFTRDGRFGTDNKGYLVNNQGLRLQGYGLDATGVRSAASGDLRLDAQSVPRATTTAGISVQLDSSAAVGTFDPANPAASSQYSTTTTVYDSLGAEHRVDVYYVSQGAGQWEWHAMVDGGDVGGTAGTPTEIGAGTLAFNSDGALQTDTSSPLSADFVNATPGQSIALDFGDALDDGGTGLAGSKQFAQSSDIIASTQDGWASGSVADVSVSDEGVVTARFSNGQSREIAQVGLASFANEDGLERMGDGLFASSRASGEALLGAAGEGSRGSLSAASLEASNVDLGNELVTLIAYQRAFQANSRTVTTADEMLSEIANLKR